MIISAKNSVFFCATSIYSSKNKTDDKYFFSDFHTDKAKRIIWFTRAQNSYLQLIYTEISIITARKNNNKLRIAYFN